MKELVEEINIYCDRVKQSVLDEYKGEAIGWE